jgi:hypothetical protein
MKPAVGEVLKALNLLEAGPLVHGDRTLTPDCRRPGTGQTGNHRGGEYRAAASHLTFVNSVRTSFGLLDEGEGVAEVGRELVFGGEGCGDRRGSVKCCGSRQLSKPRVKSGEILVREPAGRVDGAEQRGCGVMHGHPIPVGVSDLVVYPGKRTPGCPVHEGSGLPGESEPLVLALMGSGRLRPGHYRQIRQSEPGAISVLASSSQVVAHTRVQGNLASRGPVSRRSRARCGTATISRGPGNGLPPKGSSGPSTSRKSSGCPVRSVTVAR